LADINREGRERQIGLRHLNYGTKRNLSQLIAVLVDMSLEKNVV
jgi:hypothetical protein